MSWKDIWKLLSVYRLYNYHFSMSCMCMYVRAYPHVRVELRGGCRLSSRVFHLIFRDSFSHWTWSLPVLLGWLARKSQGHFCLYLFSVGLTIVTWVGGGWTQVLMITWQVLYQLNCLSNPSHTTHITHMHVRMCVNICMCVYLCVLK